MRQLTPFIVFAGMVATSALGSAAPVATASVYIADDLNNRIRVVNSSGTISTVAGNGTAGFSGDGGPATSAELQHPYGIAVSSTGVLFIADTLNNRIRMVAGGIITTVAGTGAPSFSGDGGPATSAGLNNPTGVAVDSAGNLYIADQRNERIRMVDTSGTITTVAGNGTAGNGGDGGAATSGQLYYPTGIVVFGSPAIILIADSDNQEIRVVYSGMINTIAGTGSVGYGCTEGESFSVGLHGPTGIAVYLPAGAILIADSGNECVRIDEGEFYSTVFGNGTPSYGGDGKVYYDPSVEFNHPTGVAVDPVSGSIYIADYGNHRIRLISNSPPYDVSTFAGTGIPGFSGDGGPATSARLYNPTGIVIFVPGP